MKILTYSFIASCCSLFFAFNLQAQETITDNNTRISFPKEISFEANGKNYQLDATGVATRKKLVIKVYSIAHYLQKGVGPQDVMSDKAAKQFTIKWARDVPVDKVQGAFNDAFQKVFSQQDFAKLGPDINKFNQFFNKEAHKGDEYIIRWVPEGTIEVLINGQKAGAINNKDFAQGVWNIWLGPNSVVNRGDLLR